MQKSHMSTAEPENSSGEMIFLPTWRLHPHPDNPRKELGDLTELADSIKANGVYQNLTVVPDISGATADFTVIIGHRRLAAAKLAGLTHVPCIITEMDAKEQIQTMLLENMQRSDLTVYEQAQGFQMMLDMGDTVDDIAEKSGFSTTTVRRRVKLLELDKDKFKESEERGGSLSDYMELDKLKSPKRKNAVLEHIGTENFRFQLKKAIDEEKNAERREEWAKVLSTFAAQVDTRNGYRTVKTYYTSQQPEAERPEDADTVQYFFCIEKWGYIALMTKFEEQTASPEEEAKKREEQLKQERKATAVKMLLEATARAYELRSEFVASVSAAAIKKHMADIIALWAYAEYWGETGYLSKEKIEKAANTIAVDIEDDDSDARFTLQAATEWVKKSPEQALLRMIYERVGDYERNGYLRQWNPYFVAHKENKKLDRVYALLEKLGYEISDDEKALRDGTHELLRAYEQIAQ